MGALFQLLRPGGTLHLIGYAAGTSVSFDIFDAIRRAPTIHIGSGGSRSSFEALVAAVERNGLRPVVGRRLPADDWRQGFEALDAGGVPGKIVLELQ